MVEVVDPNTGESFTFYLAPSIKGSLDRKKAKLKSKDQDEVWVVDGEEGSGKSVFSMQICKYMDPSFGLDDVCMTPQEFKTSIMNAKQKKSILYDEGFTGLSSRSSLSQINRMLVSLMMQMRQKNLFVIIALPSIYMLDRYAAMFRTSALAHIYQSKGRHLFFMFNRRNKKKLLLEGKQTFSYAPTIKKHGLTFKGEFRGKYVLDEKAYRDKKRKALEEVEEYETDTGKIERDKLIYLIHKEFNLIPREIAELFHTYHVFLKQRQIYEILKKLNDKNRCKDLENNNEIVR